jgi:hypothetical protein
MIVLPITFTHIKAQLQEKQIAVDWVVENELGIQQYDIQKSSDGVHFITIASQAPRFNNGNNASYKQIDEIPFTGYNYYRIRSIANNGGGVAYSKIVKVWVDEREKMFSVHPNPVKDNQFNVLFSNQFAGNYKMELFNYAGQLVFVKTIAHAGGNKNYSIQPLVSLSTGTYLLKISGSDNLHFSGKLIVE